MWLTEVRDTFSLHFGIVIQVEADNHGWSQGGQAESLVLMVVLKGPGFISQWLPGVEQEPPLDPVSSSG